MDDDDYRSGGAYSGTAGPDSDAISGANSDSGGADLLFFSQDNTYPECRVFSKNEILQATKNWERQIASGGFGTVYAGKIMQQFREIGVAVKRYANNPFRHMRHELHHIMSIPEHPHLIRAIGKCEEENCVCIVLPLLTPLLNGANFVPLTGQERLQVCCDVTEAVVYLHSARRLHRDIKPHNILLDSQKRAVLTDLGITEEVSATKPRGGFSPSYAPPEWMNAPDAPASKFSGDIFCLGLTITSIVALREPANNNTDRQALIRSLQPRSLQQLVRQMVDDNQARRPAASGVLSQLSQLQASGVAVSSSPGAPAADAGGMSVSAVIPLGALVAIAWLTRREAGLRAAAAAAAAEAERAAAAAAAAAAAERAAAEAVAAAAQTAAAAAESRNYWKSVAFECAAVLGGALAGMLS